MAGLVEKSTQPLLNNDRGRCAWFWRIFDCGGGGDVPGVGDKTDDIRQNPTDEELNAEERSRFLNPWYIGTIGITLTKFFDEFTGEVESIASSYYKNDELNYSAYQTSEASMLEGMPGALEIVFLVLCVCFPIFGSRVKYYFIAAKLMHAVCTTS